MMPPLNKQIVQEAAEWFVEFNTDTPDADTRKRFDTWLRASPEHVRAYLEIVPIWEDGGRLDANATAEQLIQMARASDNVIAIPVAAAPPQPAKFGPGIHAKPTLRHALLAASVVVVALGAAIMWRYQQVRDPTYATGVGELRSFLLPDKSTVELNTHSKIRIHYSEQQRTVELLEGQALFEVVKNNERPFIVYSGDTRVRAVGTRFDVYRKEVGTTITVVEGRVAVYSGSDVDGGAADFGKGMSPMIVNVPGSLLLGAGEQLTVGVEVTQPVERPSVAGVTAWTQRQLVFDFTPLKDVAEEFNRYNTRRVIIDTEDLGDFQISGIFSSTDPSSLIRFLRAQPGVDVVELEDRIQVSRN